MCIRDRDNNLTYVDYSYATDGITGSDVDHTTIDHLSINGNLALAARGIYFTSGDSLTITNNYIDVDGAEGIYANNATYSDISSNTIITPSYGIRAYDCDYCSINENNINSDDGVEGPNYGISADQSHEIKALNNSIVADEHGIYVPTSLKATINKNRITGAFRHNGINVENSDSSTIKENYIKRTWFHTYTGNWDHLIDAENSEGSTIVRDTLLTSNWNHHRRDNEMIIRCEWSRVDSNYILSLIHI